MTPETLFLSGYPLSPGPPRVPVPEVAGGPGKGTYNVNTMEKSGAFVKWVSGMRRDPFFYTCINEEEAIHDLPSALREDFLVSAAGEGPTGGRIYDAHIAEIARQAGARLVATENRRHFTATNPPSDRWGVPEQSPHSRPQLLRRR